MGHFKIHMDQVYDNGRTICRFLGCICRAPTIAEFFERPDSQSQALYPLVLHQHLWANLVRAFTSLHQPEYWMTCYLLLSLFDSKLALDLSGCFSQLSLSLRRFFLLCSYLLIGLHIHWLYIHWLRDFFLLSHRRI